MNNDANSFSRDVYQKLLESCEIKARVSAIDMGVEWSEIMLSEREMHNPIRQILAIIQYGLFDEVYYCSVYKDVVASGIDPLVHYVHYGDDEGRWPNRFFDPNLYRKNFKNEDCGPVCSLYHYLMFGEAYGLAASSAFNAQRYIISNPQLKSWLDYPLTHYLNIGEKSGLRSNLRARHAISDSVEVIRDNLPGAPPISNDRYGFNLIGPLDRVSGLGVSARGYFHGLVVSGAYQIGAKVQRREFAIQASQGDSFSGNPFLDHSICNFYHMNGDTLPSMLREGGEDIFKDKLNVAIWYWELHTLRPDWQASMKYFHEFWAPTPFIESALKRSTAKRVTLLPPYLPQLKNLSKWKVNGKGSPGVEFLYCFDANSILERKNPVALLQAFLLAFPRQSTRIDVSLIFKITYPDRKNSDVARLYSAAENDDRIKIIDNVMSDDEFHALIANCTAYISPHRSEGLGLTVVEAMAAGVPVVATGFGGVETFVTEDSAYPVAFKLEELADDYIPYPKGFVWANPEIDSIAEKLIEIVNYSDDALEKAAIGRNMVLNYFSSGDLLLKYKEELNRLNEFSRF